MTEALNYATRVKQQVAQYTECEDMHAMLSDINDYWKKKHHSKRFRKVTGTQNHIDFYARHLYAATEASGFCRIVSIGSGDGALEVQVAQKLETLGMNDYEFHLVEMSPYQNARAKKNVEHQKLKGRVITVEADLNNWVPAQSYSGAMAHHSLHHVLELEHLFNQIYNALDDNGRFVTFDIIGRNGHQRWPETYSVINALWHFLPEKKRYHTILKWTSENYRDHDCSTQGFEGIRAQDILPELIKKFHFDTFFAWGGLTDVFTGRSYGGNFDPNTEEDRAFIDLVEELNEVLIENGAIKPTCLCASMLKHVSAEPKLYLNRTPEIMLRDPQKI
jgi:SAM-dependent methyltransferase